MNYESIYNRLIENRRLNPIPDDVYGEIHHIKPRSLFPELTYDARNLIKLTAREHFVAHELLEHIYPTAQMRTALRLLANIAKKTGGRTSKYYRIGCASRMKYSPESSIGFKAPRCTVKLLSKAASMAGVDVHSYALRVIQTHLAQLVTEGRLAV